MATPERSEIVDDNGAKLRLSQLGASYRVDKSSSKKQVYWSGKYRRWIILTPYGTGTYRLDFYKDCPC